MITVETLKEYGADTEDALARCMNNADFYLMLVGKSLDDANYEKLKEMIAAKNFDEAFSAAHALKGVVTNLSLTPLATPIIEITEGLRAGKDMDYEPLLQTMDKELARLKALA
ncbi:MAG: Hpt domain-containing protein [Lachnospiraceae bacterium]|nr:Hpt domain-containing protein [Lachnospiraceae bacterium]